jgi:hypothetical protein
MVPCVGIGVAFATLITQVPAPKEERRESHQSPNQLLQFMLIVILSNSIRYISLTTGMHTVGA